MVSALEFPSGGRAHRWFEPGLCHRVVPRTRNSTPHRLSLPRCINRLSRAGWGGCCKEFVTCTQYVMQVNE